MNLRYLPVFLVLTAVFIHEANPMSLSEFFKTVDKAEKEESVPMAAKITAEVCERFLTENDEGSLSEKSLKKAASRAAEIIGRLSVSPVSSPEETKTGTEFPAPFVAEISVKESENGIPAGDNGTDGDSPLSCTAIFPRTNYTEAEPVNFMPEAIPGGNFSASFTPPVPAQGVTGELKITFTFMNKAARTLKLLSQYEKDTAGKLTAVFPYRVMSAKNISTVISVLDIDKNGKPVASPSPSGTELLRQIIRCGFKSTGTADFSSQLASDNEQELYKAAENLFAGTVKRFVYGTVRVEAVDKSPEGSFTASLRAEINTYDFHTKEKTGSHVFKISSSGNTESAAIQKAREDLCAGIIAPELEYAM